MALVVPSGPIKKRKLVFHLKIRSCSVYFFKHVCPSGMKKNQTQSSTRVSFFQFSHFPHSIPISFLKEKLRIGEGRIFFMSPY